MHRSLVVVLLFLIVPALAAEQVVVISDTHFGYGLLPSGEWRGNEDFRWADDFDSFLRYLDASSGSATTLVFAGDTFELWESDPERCVGDKDHGCNETEVVDRLEAILAAHDAEVRSLRRFASAGRNRIVIVPGNHDGAILFPKAARTIVDRIAVPGKVEVVLSGVWIMPGTRTVVVEHGHQADQTNMFPGWPAPFAGSLIHRPFGEQFVREFFDRYEEKFPVIDNFSDPVSGIGYARASGQVKLTRAARDFVKFYLRDASLRQKIRFLEVSGTERPQWDIPATRLLGTQFLLESIPHDSTAELMQQTLAGELSPADFTDAEISELCMSRYLQWKTSGAPAESGLCPKKLMYLVTKLGSWITGRDLALEGHLELLLSSLKNEQRIAAGPVTYIYGHTHSARATRNAEQPGVTITNTGAWQRIIAPAGVEAMHLAPKDVLASLTLERLPPCYSYVVLNGSTPKLCYWKREPRQYTVADSCAERE